MFALTSFFFFFPPFFGSPSQWALVTRMWNLGHRSYFGFCSGIAEKATFNALLASVTAVAALVAASCHSANPGFPALRTHSHQGCSIIIINIIILFFYVSEHHLSVCVLSKIIVESFVTKLSVTLCWLFHIGGIKFLVKKGTLISSHLNFRVCLAACWYISMQPSSRSRTERAFRLVLQHKRGSLRSCTFKYRLFCLWLWMVSSRRTGVFPTQEQKKKKNLLWWWKSNFSAGYQLRQTLACERYLVWEHLELKLMYSFFILSSSTSIFVRECWVNDFAENKTELFLVAQKLFLICSLL